MFMYRKATTKIVSTALFVSVVSLLLAAPVFAQCEPGSGSIDLGSCLRLSNDREISEVYDTPAFLVNLIVRNLFVAGAVVLFLLIFYAGFLFVMKGKDGVADAKQIATNALIGFVVMFSAYWIVQIIALITGTNIQL